MGVSPLTITASVRGTIISLATVSRKERILCIISPSSSLRSPSSSPTSMSCWISFSSCGCDVFLRCRTFRRVAILRHTVVSGPSSKGLKISLCKKGRVFAPSSLGPGALQLPNLNNLFFPLSNILSKRISLVLKAIREKFVCQFGGKKIGSNVSRLGAKFHDVSSHDFSSAAH